MDQDIHEVIGRALSGEASQQDQDILNEWLTASGKNQREYDFLKKTWQQTSVHYQAPCQEAVFKNVLSEIDEHHEKSISNPQRKPASSKSLKPVGNRKFLITRIAAGLIVLVSCVFVLQHYFDKEENAPKIQHITKVNGAGQKSKIFLPDGSIAWLNSESEISYPDSFPANARIVRLKGEAFFEVASDAYKPFTVISGNVSTTALGTSFNIRDFADEKNIVVALATGKVKINFAATDGAKEVVLMPNEGISYNTEKHRFTKKAIDPKESFSWKDGDIYFKDASLDEVLKTLGRWYGVEFTVHNKDNEPWSYTGEFDNAYLKNVLESISFTKNFEFTIDNKKVTIDFKKEK